MKPAGYLVFSQLLFCNIWNVQHLILQMDACVYFFPFSLYIFFPNLDSIWAVFEVFRIFHCQLMKLLLYFSVSYKTNVISLK